MSEPDGLEPVEPSLALRAAYLDMVADFGRAGGSAHRRLAVDEGGFEEFVAELKRQASGSGLPEGYVPQTTYWLLRSDGAILGTGRLRHGLTASLELWGGHAGYDIRPSARRRGYGTRLLAMLLERARERGIPRVLLTCDDENVASRRVIEANGGILADRLIPAETGRLTRRYWIDLS